MKKQLVVQGRLSDAQLAELSGLFEVEVLPKTTALNDPANHALLANVHGIIGSGLAITPQLLDAAPKLKVIATISVGYDNIPVDELTKRGIMLCNTPDVLTETTADTGFTLIMADKWQASIGPALFGSDVHGKTLGMVGFGRIGQAVARRGALGFGMKVIYSNASPKPELESELGAQRRELNELLAEADFVCVTVPLTAETERLVGAQEFALMKPSGIFINIARGKVVDESALIDALENGVIQAAGLDVFEQEPLRATSPLTKMPNVVALPHIGSATHETRDAMAQRAVNNIRLALQGERPISLVNEEACR
ncbi:D-glycerate dehydrogenase [Vreelandella maris]|uniref:2-hydroxyacid dehydrogenase n=1 Tax=Vreelandella maris TaxID=2729617 RepID=UPI0030EDBFA8